MKIFIKNLRLATLLCSTVKGKRRSAFNGEKRWLSYATQEGDLQFEYSLMPTTATTPSSSSKSNDDWFTLTYFLYFYSNQDQLGHSWFLYSWRLNQSVWDRQNRSLCFMVILIIWKIYSTYLDNHFEVCLRGFCLKRCLDKGLKDSRI